MQIGKIFKSNKDSHFIWKFFVNMKILLTGVSSFTGFCLAKELSKSGYLITCPLPRSKTSYSGLKKKRLGIISEKVNICYNSPFGSENFMKILDGGFTIYCLHGAYVEGYQSDEFDFSYALNQNLNQIDSVLKVAKSYGCKSVIWTSSIFEDAVNTEEKVSGVHRPVWLKYALSKKISFLCIRELCANYGLGFSRFVISNPFGPYEDAKFCYHLVHNILAGKKFDVQSPYYVRDMIHIGHLSESYVMLVKNSIDGDITDELRPSEYPMRMIDFAALLCKKINHYYGIDYELGFCEQKKYDEPLVLVNNNNIRSDLYSYNESSQWNRYFQYYNVIEYK